MISGGTETGRPLLWAALTCVIAAFCGVIAYAIGSSAGGGDPGASERPARAAPAPRRAPALVPFGRIYASARAEGARSGADRAYARGRRHGLIEGRRAARRELDPEGLRRLRALRPGSYYLLGFGPNGNVQDPTLVEPGRSYTLCRNGGAVCAERRR